MDTKASKVAEPKAPKGPRDLPPLPITKGPLAAHIPPTAPPATPPTRLSFAERKHSRYRSRQPRLEPVIEGDSRLLREVRDLPPGDTRPTRRVSKPELAKRRSEYFEDVFQNKDAGSTGDRVRDEAMVVAEVKTNVIIPDEFTFITDLSQHLSERYHRQTSSIVVTLQHRMCLFFAGSFAPAYSITISALPSQLQTATNKRNCLLLQMHLDKALKVVPARGVVRYLPVPDECFGWNGRTIAGETAEAVGRPSPNDTNSPVRRRRTLPTLPMRRSHPTATPNGPDNAAKSPEQAPDDSQWRGHENSPSKPESEKKIRTKKSFIHTLFQRPSKAINESLASEGGHNAADQPMRAMSMNH